jgi:hypothetical protein
MEHTPPALQSPPCQIGRQIGRSTNDKLYPYRARHITISTEWQRGGAKRFVSQGLHPLRALSAALACLITAWTRYSAILPSHDADHVRQHTLTERIRFVLQYDSDPASPRAPFAHRADRKILITECDIDWGVINTKVDWGADHTYAP